MNGVKASAVVKCLIVGLISPLLLGQSPPNRTQTRPPVNETLGVNRPQIGILVPRTSTVPLLFGMNRVEVARVLEPLRLKPSFSGIENGVAVDQKPAAGTKVPYGSSVAVTLGLMPRLVLNGPAAPAYAGSELTFTVKFVPPLPAGPKPIYQFTWGDGSPVESTTKTVITHRFADAGARVVSVIWTLDNRVKIGSARVGVDVLSPPNTTQTSVVPFLFGMNRNQVARVLRPLQLRPQFSGPENGIALEQKPEAGTKVPYGSGVAVMLGLMPRLVLNGPAAPAYAGSELPFRVSFVPPLPAGLKPIYEFTWGDGSPVESTTNAALTHRFADAGNRVVSGVGIIDGRFKIGSRVPVDVLAPPPPTDTTPSTTDATTSDTTATVATDGTATEPTTTTESTTSSATTTTAPTTTAEPTTTTAPETIRTDTVSPPNPSSNLLVWIGAAAVVLLLVVTFLLARVLRALNRKEPQVQAKPAAAFNGGMRSIEYEIEHPELIRRMPEVGLRGGIRGEGDGDV